MTRDSSDKAPADWQRQFLREQRLPDSYLITARRFFDPLAALIAERARVKGSTLFVALNGSQGSGKSTLGAYLVASLKAEHALGGVALSIDDFYLTRPERTHLANTVHPLLATRGVPGTHDMGLLLTTMRALGLSRGSPVAVPRFDKSTDDRVSQGAWQCVRAPLDVVLLEGWCLGAHGEDAEALREPINTLEREEDRDALWRGYSNQQLHDSYERVYAQFDLWVMLAAPGFEQVLAWRIEQEQKLRDAVGGRGEGLMDDAQLARFVAHFERYTRQCLRELPDSADVCLQLDAQRNIVRTRGLERYIE